MCYGPTWLALSCPTLAQVALNSIMDRGWYLRFVVMLTSAVVGWLVLWPSLDAWIPAPPLVKQVFEGKIVPGLDIRGGLRLIYEAEVDEAIWDMRDTRAEQLKEVLGRKFKIIPNKGTPTRQQLDQITQRVEIIRDYTDSRKIRLKFKKTSDAARMDRKLLQELGDLKEVSRDDTQVVLEVREDRLEALRDEAVQQAKRTIENRIDELQLRQTSVASREADIIIEIPGEDEKTFQLTREIIGKTAQLEFKVLDDDTDFVATLTDVPKGIEKAPEAAPVGPNRQANTTYLVARGDQGRDALANYLKTLAQSGRIPEDHQLLMGSEAPADSAEGKASQMVWRTYYLFSRSEVGGEEIQDAFVTEGTRPEDPPFYVSIAFQKPRGANLFEELTGRNVKRRMAIVLDDRVESAPVIQTRIGGGQAQITLGMGPNIQDEAKNLSIVLKAGALPVPIRPSNEQLIGPTLGQDAVQQGAIGAAVGVALVMLFMLLYYEVGGLIANLMVLLNLMLLFAFLAVASATLTLPGIAGIALTVGMAVDANVLIMERIREELRDNKSPRAAVDQGFHKAFSSIMDGQLTTLIAGIVLYQFGTGPIRGFAVTLMAGILSSLFTGVFCSRICFEWWVRRRNLQRLRVG